MKTKFIKETGETSTDKIFELGVFAIGIGGFIAGMNFLVSINRDPLAPPEKYPWIPYVIAGSIAVVGAYAMIVRTRSAVIFTASFLFSILVLDVLTFWIIRQDLQWSLIKGAIYGIPLMLIVKTCSQALAKMDSSKPKDGPE